MAEIVDLIEAHDLGGKVMAFPLNSQRELAAAYRILARGRGAFALTALYEPFGLAPLEAMSCGLPAVVTENGGPTESMREGEREFGVLVDPTDPADIARGLLRVLHSEEAWTRFHRAGIERVVSRYTWARTAEGYLRVLETVLDTPHVGGLPIPAYFTAPQPQNDIPVTRLNALYFEGGTP
jgi:sucrose-phosphate synthase